MRISRNRYNEWVLCLKGTNGDADACKGVRQMMTSICPDDWVSADFCVLISSNVTRLKEDIFKSCFLSLEK